MEADTVVSHPPPGPVPLDLTLARDIRALRKARGLTLVACADRLGRSVGWLSQVERGLSVPSLADLRARLKPVHELAHVTIECHAA